MLVNYSTFLLLCYCDLLHRGGDLPVHFGRAMPISGPRGRVSLATTSKPAAQGPAKQQKQYLDFFMIIHGWQGSFNLFPCDPWNHGLHGALLHVLTVVPFAIGQPNHPLLEDRVFPFHRG